MAYYKILRTNRASWFNQKFVWPLRKSVRVEGATKGDACDVGLHLAKSIDNAFCYAEFPARVFNVEPLSEVLGEDEVKIRVAEAHLREEITPKYVRRVNAFIGSLKRIPWFQATKSPRKTWQVFENRDAARNAVTYAARNAVTYAARNAVTYAARNAAMFATKTTNRITIRAAAGEAATRTASRIIVRAATGEAALYTVEDALDAAMDASLDAILWAQILACDGLPLNREHVANTRARMDVWHRGYGHLCDADGVLFVYRRP